MPKLDSGLEPGLGVFDRRRLFSDRALWTAVFGGAAVLCAFVASMWDYSGNLIDQGATLRYIVVVIAALYGLLLGWMIFPRFGKSRDV